MLTEVKQLTGDKKWIPQPGPQTDAYYSEADILLYGGAGGGGKTDFGLGLAFNEHERTLMLRRKYTDLSGIIDRAVEINGSRKGLNASAPPKFRISDKQLIEFGAAQKVGDEQSWMGRPHDLLVVDEAAHFAGCQIRLLMGWVRSATEGQRCRVVFVTNPPLSDEGLWLIEMFAPWIDPEHPRYPTPYGELLWYVTDAGTDHLVDGPGDYMIGEDGTPIQVEDDTPDSLTAMSRTFIPSKLSDNAYLMRDKQYKAQQDALPEHIRAAIRDGDFMAKRQDHDLQLIPSEWIKAAQRRWGPEPPEGIPMTAVAADVAQGGIDNTVVQPRYDWWFPKPEKIPGADTPLGRDVAGEVLKVRRDRALIIIDMGGGYGGATYEQLMQSVPEDEMYKYKGADSVPDRTTYSNLGFRNRRTHAYWMFREALDPSQPGGAKIALPPSASLFADLCAIRQKKTRDDDKIITLEPKKDLVARLGRSTDEGDSVVMCWYKGIKGANIQGGWAAHQRNARPEVRTGGRAPASRGRSPTTRGGRRR
jgi:hypothetical protein